MGLHSPGRGVSPAPPPEIHIHQVLQQQQGGGGDYEGPAGPLQKRMRLSESWNS